MIGLVLALALSSTSPCTLPTVAATPKPDATTFVTVVLPAKLDPSGCPQELPHGTRVFKVPRLLFAWSEDEVGTQPNGAQVLSDVFHFQFVNGYGMKVHEDDGHTIVTDECGNSYTLPAGKSLYDPGGEPGFNFAFFAPNQPLTKEFCKAVPDYVVP